MSLPSPEALLSEVPGYAGASLRPFGTGSANALYLIEPSEPEALLRLHDSGARMSADRRREHSIWRQAADAGLSPDLYHWDAAHRFAVAQRWGRRADRLAPHAAVCTLAGFHRLPIDAAPLDYASSLDNQAQQWQQRMLASRLSPGMTHHDPGRGNWLRQGEELRLIDFEYAGFGHPLWDLACLMLEWPNMAEAARLYYRVQGLEADGGEELALQAAGHLYLLTCLRWCDQALQQGGEPRLIQGWTRRYRQQLAAGPESLLTL
ncbi:phosphotransferase [Ferrimonas futtsuensis]|uniref:phosphotransferase n=1 Tax=Ferrimonas futtsuensis TaxID=364764 RepID=UPI000429B3A8|nr:phosphotransferase [Ferrimonas futtsuensis]